MSGATAVTIGTAVATSVAGALVSSLLAPDAPKTPKAVPLPTSATEDAARRQSIMEQQKRQGRASTILTDTSDTLG